MEFLVIGLETSIIGYMITSFFLSVAFLWYAYYLVGYAIVLRRLIDQNPELLSYSPAAVMQPKSGLGQEAMAQNPI